jgi:hypothetical protein
LKELCREHFAIFAAADLSSPLSGFGIYPGNSIDYQKSADVVSHGSSALSKAPFSQDSSLSSAPHIPLFPGLSCAF